MVAFRENMPQSAPVWVVDGGWFAVAESEDTARPFHENDSGVSGRIAIKDGSGRSSMRSHVTGADRFAVEEA